LFGLADFLALDALEFLLGPLSRALFLLFKLRAGLRVEVLAVSVGGAPREVLLAGQENEHSRGYAQVLDPVHFA
jgi:hypothetical protein